MIISGYGVVLEPRNQSELSDKAQFSWSSRIHGISENNSEQQQIWFARIDNANNNYFVIMERKNRFDAIDITKESIKWRHVFRQFILNHVSLLLSLFFWQRFHSFWFQKNSDSQLAWESSCDFNRRPYKLLQGQEECLIRFMNYRRQLLNQQELKV